MLKIAILGTGNIGTDLLVKVLRSHHLKCGAFIGRNLGSAGMRKAEALGVRVASGGIQTIIDEPDLCDLVFDATSAADHVKHWPILRALGKRVVDLTPSRVGTMTVPAININALLGNSNVNMVSCGGQASLPIAYAIAKTHPNVEYIEVVSSIASKSAGSATRANIDEYVETTESAIQYFTHCAKSKVILILNPAQPSIHMQTTISAKVARADLGQLSSAVDEMVSTIQRYVPGYALVVPPVFDQNRIVVMVRVTGRGDHLPCYAGNLDIINCAAIAAAENYAVRDRRATA